MGFTREYMAEQGDPFSLRVPKRLRKMKVGRAIGNFAKKALPIASAFIPGVGAFAGGVVAKILNRIPRPVINQLQALGYEPQEIATSFARNYGLELGDPGKAAPHPAKKRKTAAAGPKAKAEKKRAVRRNRAVRGNSGAKPPVAGHGRGGEIDWGGILGGAAAKAGGATIDMGKDLLHGDYGAVFGDLMGGKKGAALGAGGRHRRINPVNVKALKRGIRRIEGFEKIVKQVHKAYPRIARATHSGVSSRSRGHKHGCRCFACKRAAA